MTYMKGYSPSFSGMTTDQRVPPTLAIGVALLTQPLKDPTRQTALAPGAEIVNRTPPGVTLGGSGPMGLAQLQVPINATNTLNSAIELNNPWHLCSLRMGARVMQV